MPLAHDLDRQARLKLIVSQQGEHYEEMPNFHRPYSIGSFGLWDTCNTRARACSNKYTSPATN
jgi:hypothetical protein